MNNVLRSFARMFRKGFRFPRWRVGYYRLCCTAERLVNLRFFDCLKTPVVGVRLSVEVYFAGTVLPASHFPTRATRHRAMMNGSGNP
jgi:hypothetical protein